MGYIVRFLYSDGIYVCSEQDGGAVFREEVFYEQPVAAHVTDDFGRVECL
ncbi:MAG: hypothetical protein V8R91_12875 [Butyricimonas faecihominis]